MTHSCSVPRTTRARATDTPRVARPVALTPWQYTRLLWQAGGRRFASVMMTASKRYATLFRNISFLPFLSLSPQGSGNGTFQRSPSQRRKRAPSPPTDQGFEGCSLRGSVTAQSTRAPSPLLIRGSKAGPSKGFDSRPSTCRVRDDPGYVRYMAEARATLPRYPRTFPRPAGTDRKSVV